MPDKSLARRVAAEWLGSLLLLAAIVGSGIMGGRLAGGNVAIALLANTMATGAILSVLILVLGPLSGAHFNPLVTLALCSRSEHAWRDAVPYILAQLAGGFCGVWLAHVMFDLSILQASQTVRTGLGQWVSEAVATFGLLLTIVGTAASARRSVPWAVGLYIVAAYWFTASTSFANPMVTVARSLSDTFAGIAPTNVPAFVAAQLCGAILGGFAARYLFAPAKVP